MPILFHDLDDETAPSYPAILDPPDIQCGPADWQIISTGTPYANTGNTTAGLVDLIGNGLPAVVAGHLQYAFPPNANPDPTSGSYQSNAFAFPVAAGDFTVQFDFLPSAGLLDYGMGLIFFDNTNQGFGFGGGAWTVTTGGLFAYWSCDTRIAPSSTGPLNPIVFTPPLPNAGVLPLFNGGTIRLVRVGTVVEYFLNAISVGTYDIRSLVVGKIGFAFTRRTWNGDTPTFDLYNMTITSP